MKLTSQTLLVTCLTPTRWPANTVLRLIFRLPKQMLPQRLIRESLVQAFRQSLVESELSLPDISPTNQVSESLIQQACAEQLP